MPTKGPPKVPLVSGCVPGLCPWAVLRGQREGRECRAPTSVTWHVALKASRLVKPPRNQRFRIEGPDTRGQLYPRRCPGSSRATLCNPHCFCSLGAWGGAGGYQSDTQGFSNAVPEGRGWTCLAQLSSRAQSPARVRAWGYEARSSQNKRAISPWPGDSLSLPLVPFPSMTEQARERVPTPTQTQRHSTLVTRARTALRLPKGQERPLLCTADPS